MKLSFHGADRSVTGSCHLVECAGKRILIDCGLNQGSRELDEENAEPFGFDAAGINYVLLTHAHLDHCGRLPLLAKRGFRGEIITTSASRELARLVMLDAAHLQEEDVRYRARRGRRDSAAPDKSEPLYSTIDALHCFDYFGRTATYGEVFEVAAGVRATFIDAGHILGSACIFLELEEQSHSTSVLFSGDLGNAGRFLLRSPAKPPRAENVVMETTYGDRLHKPIGPSIDEFYEAITETFKRGGNVIIPTFALERAQELLYFLNEGITQGRLAKSAQVYLDSPMAISATEIFRRHPECLELAVAKLFQEGHDPFNLPGLHFTRETAESIGINSIHGGAIIMAGAGMCTGGRVRHHLQHNLGREEFEHHIRRLRSHWHSCAPYYRRRQAGEYFGRRYSSAGSHLHHQWFLRPCRSGRVAGLATADQCQTYLPCSRRRGHHEAVCGASCRHSRRNAGAQSSF